MIQVCPNCGDFNAGEGLNFCPLDGSPMVSVDPHDTRWAEGRRVLEEKAAAWKKQQQRTKLRRVVTSVVTLAVAGMFVLVVAINAVLLVRPDAERVALVQSGSPTDPGGSTTTISGGSSPTGTPTPAPTATPIETGTPTGTKSPPVTPTDPNPGPTTTEVQGPKCSASDQGRERAAILARYDASWRKSFESERPRIVAEHTTPGAPGTEAVIQGVEYQFFILENCSTGQVIANYAWTVRTSRAAGEGAKVITLNRSRSFTCGKIGAEWRCN